MYMHFYEQSKYVMRQLDSCIDFAKHTATYPRKLEKLPTSLDLPVVEAPEVVELT